MKNRIKHKVNILKERFAKQNVLKQLGVIFVLSMAIVFISGVLLGSLSDSYLLFVDPSSLPSSIHKSGMVVLYEFFLMVSGIVITGFIISVLSTFLEETLSKIKEGQLNYYGSDHTMIVNINHEIYNILRELDALYKSRGHKHDVVILSDSEHAIKMLLEFVEETHFEYIEIYVRYGEVLWMERYFELSVDSLFALIILKKEEDVSNFESDNLNIRITNMLVNNKRLRSYFEEKRKALTPVKAIVEFSETAYIEEILKRTTDGLFFPIAPKKILSYILNLSVIDMHFYKVWEELLTFEGHEIYFVDPNAVGIEENMLYDEVVMRQEEGLLIGISRNDNGKFQLLLNACKEPIKKGDWVIFIAENKEAIRLGEKRSVCNMQNIHAIEQPKETFVRKILVIGEEREVHLRGFLDEKESKILYENPPYEELFNRDYFDAKLKNGENFVDTIVLNLDDERMYRLALYLSTKYSYEEMHRFVFIVDDALMTEHLINIGFENTILSHLLVSRYITQISNQLALSAVIAEMTSKDGAEINFVDKKEIPTMDLDSLKCTLVQNKMSYLGVIDEKNHVIFDAKEKDISRASKIIVLCDGEV